MQLSPSRVATPIPSLAITRPLWGLMRREYAGAAGAWRQERGSAQGALKQAKAESEAQAAANAVLLSGLDALEAAAAAGGDEGTAALTRTYADTVRRMAVVQVWGGACFCCLRGA